MKALIALLICIGLTSCGGESSSEKNEEKETVFDPLIQSVDKAKAVEDTVLQQKKDMDEAMKRMEDGADDKE
ncbi:MAG: hypothetical protein OEW68_17845 [Gammaproteobacteria bacterium]|nr:hypothetical protein [Gammaproteobacteria bacterium]MDH4316680.1 hypothetical protein [Gammaproteobacteria bacterium]MDH5215779.1 hypothetical protein [Gammaproteobacteria bacterium]